MTTNHGGKRKGAGRPVGAVEAKTLEKIAVKKEFDQRVFKKTESLFQAQYIKAVGSIMVFRRDEVADKKGNVKVEYVHITDAEEIKVFFDAHDMDDGVVKDKNGVEKYYFVQKVAPDNQAINSLLDRSFGKPMQSIEITDNIDPKLYWLAKSIEAKAQNDAREKGVVYTREVYEQEVFNYSEKFIPASERESVTHQLVEIKEKLTSDLLQ